MNKKEIEIEVKKTVGKVKEKVAMADSLTNIVNLEFVINTQIAIGGTPGSIYQNDLKESFI